MAEESFMRFLIFRLAIQMSNVAPSLSKCKEVHVPESSGK